MKYDIEYVKDFHLSLEDDMEGFYKITYENSDWFSKTIVKVSEKEFRKKILKFLIELGINERVCGF